MKARKYFNRQLKKDPEFRKAWIKFQRRLVKEYTMLVWEQWHVYHTDPEEIREFRMKLRNKR